LTLFPSPGLTSYLQLVARYLRPIYPFMEKPVEFPGALKINLFRHVLFAMALKDSVEAGVF